MLSVEQINAAKASTSFTHGRSPLGNDDSIRIAYQWLAAQPRIQRPNKRARAIKHMIEAWGGHYVSEGDVEVAAQMLGLVGKHPFYNIGLRLVEPSTRRLEGIESAIPEDNGYPEYYREYYARREA